MTATWCVSLVVGPSRFCETIHVDASCYLEALTLLGAAWELRSFVRFRGVVSYCANVEPQPLDLREWIAGRAAWENCAGADHAHILRS